MNRVLAVCAPLMLLAMPPAARAGEVAPTKAPPADFEACDGLIRAGLSDNVFVVVRNEDGIYLREDPARFGRAGAAACDSALTDPGFADGHPQRHANLLQSKALHLLFAGDAVGALTALDAADRDLATITEAHFLQSLGPRIKVLRAAALAQIGRRDEALALLASVAQAFPWSPSFGMTVARLRLTIDHDLPAYLAAVAAIGRQSPDENRGLFYLDLATGRFEQALAVAPYVRFELPLIWRVYGSFSVPTDDIEKIRATRYEADLRGGMAYAEAALGRFDAAAARLAAARAAVQAMLADLPEDTPAAPLSKRQRGEIAQRRQSGASAIGDLDSWAAAIDLLKWKAGGAHGQPPASLDRLGDNLVTIAGHLTAGLPPALFENGKVARLARISAPAAADGVAALMRFDPRSLLAGLPQPENRYNYPPMKRAGNGFMRVANGYSRELKPGTDVYSIRYQRDDATRLRIEEMAMLAAALYAEHDGKDSILVLNRRTLNQIRTGVPHFAAAQGYDNQMDAMLVDAAHLPPGFEQYRDRLISVSRLLAEVRPNYDVRELPN